VAPADLEPNVQHVGAMLLSLFPGLVERIPSAPAFEVILKTHDGSARTVVSLASIDDEEFLVRANAWVLSHVGQSLALCTDLLRRNAKIDLGAYYLSEDHHVGFAHTILGSAIQLNELRASVVAVAAVADRDDDELQGLYGGYRASDLPPAL
jgi:hypothetical protein